MISASAQGPVIETGQHSLRVLIFFVGMVLLLSLLLFRFVQLQFINHDDYVLRSDSNRIVEQPLEPVRGVIFDRDGVPLATMRSSRTLSIVREEVPDLDGLLAQLQHMFTLTEAELDGFSQRMRENRRPYEPVALKFDLTLPEQAMISVDRYHLPGVRLESRNLRYYPFGDLFAHAVGSVRRISSDDYTTIEHTNYRGAQYIGKLGLEQQYETRLRGVLGAETLEVRASGRVTRQLAARPPAKGKDLHTELSMVLHETALQALGEHHGAVVAIDPRSGAIRALVSTPSYDPNLFITGLSAEQYQSLTADPRGPLFNRATTGLYAPGSTIKPIIGLAGIASQHTDWQRSLWDPGFFRLPGSSRQYRDWTWRPGGVGGHGEVDLHRAIYRSANTYFFELASRMKPEQISGYLSDFGFGRTLSLDIPGVLPGLVPTPEWKRTYRNDEWRPGDNLNLSIGQGYLLVSPLQLATATAILANRGRLIRPYLFSGAHAAAGNAGLATPILPSPGQEDFERMAEAMKAVVHRGNMGYGGNGTAWAYIGMDIPYSMSGKSGTAQVVRQQQGEYVTSEDLPVESRNHAWFVAYAPTEAPSIAVAVLVEHGGSGSETAAPVARAVIDAWMAQEA